MVVENQWLTLLSFLTLLFSLLIGMRKQLACANREVNAPAVL